MSIDFVIMGSNKQVQVYSNRQVCNQSQFRSTRQFMEYLCLQNGTTLDGGYKASGNLLKNKYKRPIYIGGSCNQIFVPISSIKNINTTWISLDYLLDLDEQFLLDMVNEPISKTRLQKHLINGIELKKAIFNHDKKETFN